MDKRYIERRIKIFVPVCFSSFTSEMKTIMLYIGEKFVASLTEITCCRYPFLLQWILFLKLYSAWLDIHKLHCCENQNFGFHIICTKRYWFGDEFILLGVRNSNKISSYTYRTLYNLIYISKYSFLWSSNNILFAWKLNTAKKFQKYV